MSVPGPRTPRASNVSLALARARLGVWPVVFIVMAAAAPLTVVAGGATTGFAVTGVVGIPVAYLAVAVALGLFSVGYVAMSRCVVNAGAFYTYVSRGLGRVPGVGASFVAVAAYNTMQIGLYGGFGAVLAGLLDDWLGWSVPWAVCAFAGWLVVAVLGVRRIDLNGRVLAVILLVEIAVAAVFAVVQLAHPADGRVTFDTLAPGNFLGAGIGAALVTAVAGFVGFEGTAVFSEESKDPQRTVAKATYRALAIIGLLYAFCAWAMSVATGPDRIVEAAKADGTELIFNLVRPYVGQTMVELGHLLFVTSLFAALLSFHNTVARYLFALGRERVLPPVLGRTSTRTRAPKIGSIVQSGLAAIVLGVYAAMGWDPIVHLFFWLTVVGGLGVLILMAGTAVAVIAFFARPANRDGVTAWRWLIAPALAAIALLWILWATIDQFHTLLGVEATNPLRWLFPGAFAVAAVLGVLWALVLRAAKPGVYAGIGRGANSVTTGLETPLDRLNPAPAASGW
ncbi:APC family permease [Krasilnikovia sp. MM14-A1259]|uniref:APC family permease n=1 Tax=Krasilnikovia sp. MM14-A1259 TaxID=3373539 RepID=UPI00382E43EB